MPTIRVSIQVSLDDVPVTNFPLFQRAAPLEFQSIASGQATGGGFVVVPSASMSVIQQAILQSSQQVTVAFNGVTATPITLTAGGVLCALGTSLTALAVNNGSGVTTQLRGLVAGV